MQHIGRERLAEYCKRSRLKQYELADLLGMHESSLSQVLSGRRRPGLDVSLRIEAVTGIPVNAWADSGRGTGDRRRSKAKKTDGIGREKSRVA